MGDAILSDHPPLDSSNYSTDDFDSLAIPPLDPMFLSEQSSGENYNLVSDLQFSLDDNYDFDITFDDLVDFNLPSDNDHDHGHDRFSIDPKSASPELGISGDHHVATYLNSSPSASNSTTTCSSGDQLNVSSPVSSQGSGNGGSGVSDSVNFVVDQKVKLEEEGSNSKNKNGSLSKRKKENGSEDTRNQKYRRSENSNANTQCVSDEDEKRKARLMRNRESAQLSRQRKKHYVEELEDKVKTMHSTIADLNSKISFFMAENATLRQQLSGGNGMRPPPMYAPMPYPWVPCAPYVVKAQGSQVPLVPIPRLKSQQPVSAAKSKKSDPKKAEGKTKKVASVSFLGLLFFVLLFGGLVPIVNVKFGGVGENGANGFVSDKFYNRHRGRVLRVDGHSNGSHENVDVGFSTGDFDSGFRIQCGRGRNGCLAEKKGRLEHLPEADELVRRGNNSKPLAASLYVPRNDKLVKIDGNLIIHSVLASERAMSSNENPEANKSKKTGLAIPRDLSPSPTIPGRYSHLYGHHNERQKALTSGSSDTLNDHKKSAAADGKLQQWFHEGLAGPLLSSGMCSEVFQFDALPTPGAIIPASSVSNITAEGQQNATNHKKGKNRRILHGLPIPLTGSDLNITGEHVGNSQKENFQGNKSVSPMVVSVLVDPREAGDIEVDGVIAPKSISRIFVVVLLDSVKYVTYSCVLPRSGPQLVTT
ncbi:bZIP transcription factor 17 [Ricinus communis]|uniref:bZIP transcription factor 17 n=1 Tax=Ricinus communis TaxID=3988 RepID=UPI00201AEE38|nr:bZIP transcription factor 17 [Ricinus communis]